MGRNSPSTTQQRQLSSVSVIVPSSQTGQRFESSNRYSNSVAGNAVPWLPELGRFLSRVGGVFADPVQRQLVRKARARALFSARSCFLTIVARLEWRLMLWPRRIGRVGILRTSSTGTCSKCSFVLSIACSSISTLAVFKAYGSYL